MKYPRLILLITIMIWGVGLSYADPKPRFATVQFTSEGERNVAIEDITVKPQSLFSINLAGPGVAEISANENWAKGELSYKATVKGCKSQNIQIPIEAQPPKDVTLPLLTKQVACSEGKGNKSIQVQVDKGFMKNSYMVIHSLIK